VESPGEHQQVADHVLADVGPVDPRGVGDGNAPVSEGVHRQVAGAGIGAGEQLQRLGVAQHVLVDLHPGDDGGVRDEFALLGRGGGAAHVVLRQALAEFVGVLRDGHAVGSLPEYHHVRGFGHIGLLGRRGLY
jgi:hypothetical protein